MKNKKKSENLLITIKERYKKPRHTASVLTNTHKVLIAFQQKYSKNSKNIRIPDN